MADTTVPTMPPAGVPQAPQGNIPAIGIPNSQDIPRLVFMAPYFETAPLAELIEPAVIEATEAALPGLVPPYVDGAANAAVQNLAVLLTGSTMTGPLYLNPVMPTAPSQAASMAYVDALLATAGIPEVPPTPVGQVWGRQTGQWTPIDLSGGTFLPLAGGVMQGQINMSGNSIINLAPVPQFPYGAAPAQWVLDQISNAALYQGTWNADTNTPNLTLSGFWQNGFSWIVVTQNPDGVVVSETIPGLTGNTVMQGDTIVYSTVQAQFGIITSGALTLAQANALFVALMGGQMTGPLLLSGSATQAQGATTLAQVQQLVTAAAFPEPPGDGQTYGRNGLQNSWLPVVNTAGGIMTGPLQLSGNATQSNMATPLQQVQSLITAGTAAYLPLTGGSLTGPLSVGAAQGGTVAAQLTVGGQGINYAPLGANGSNIAWAVNAGLIYCYQNGANVGGPVITAAGGTFTGPITLSANAAGGLQPVSLQQLQGGWLPLTGGALSGILTINIANAFIQGPVGGSALWLGSPTSTVLGIDTYPGSPTMLFRAANNTPAAPGVIQPGQSLGDICWSGWIGGSYQQYPGVYIRPSPNENWSGSAQGAQLAFGVQANGTVPNASQNVTWMLNVNGAGINVAGWIEADQLIVAPTFQVTGSNAFAMYLSGGFPTINWAPNIYTWYNGGNGILNWAGPSFECMSLNMGTGQLQSAGAMVAPQWSCASLPNFYLTNYAGQPTINWSAGYYDLLDPGGARQWFGNPAGLTMQLTWDGNLTTLGTVNSDPQVKVNLGNVTWGLGALAQLVPIMFRYNGLAGSFPDRETAVRFGLDATTVQGAMPQAVTASPQKLHPTDTETVPILSLDYTAIYMAMLNGINQIVSRLEVLEKAAGITPTAAQTA